MNQTLKVSFAISRRIRRDGFTCRDEGRLGKPLGSRMVMFEMQDEQRRIVASLDGVKC